MGGTNVARDGRTMTVRVSISIRRRGGRKIVLAPDGTEITAPVIRHVDNAMVKAIARAFRWRDMLESGAYATIREIAAAEKINETYVGRVLRVTLLAPTVVEAIVDGRQPVEMTLAALMPAIPGVLAGAASDYGTRLFATTVSLGPQILKARTGR